MGIETSIIADPEKIRECLETIQNDEFIKRARELKIRILTTAPQNVVFERMPNGDWVFMSPGLPIKELRAVNEIEDQIEAQTARICKHYNLDVRIFKPHK